MGDTTTTGTEELLTIDQLLRQRAVDTDQTPLLAYPKTPLGVDDYELFTGAYLNKLIDGVAKVFLEAGIEPVVSILLYLIPFNSYLSMHSQIEPIWSNVMWSSMRKL